MEEVQKGRQIDIVILDEFLFKRNQLYISDYSFRVKIIRELHEEGHVGHDQTFQLVVTSYF